MPALCLCEITGYQCVGVSTVGLKYLLRKLCVHVMMYMVLQCISLSFAVVSIIKFFIQYYNFL